MRNSRMQSGRSRLLLTLTVILLVTSGCWSAREIDELAFIMAIGVDKAESGEGLEVSFRIVNPSQVVSGESGGGQNTGETSFPVMVQAVSVVEAFDRLRERLPRRPFLSHIQLVIVGEELAKEGIGGILDYLERSEETRRSVNILVAKGGRASKIFEQARPPLLSRSGLAAEGLLRQAPDVGHAPQVILGDLMYTMQSGRMDPVVGVITIIESNSPSTQSLPAQVRLSGGALFRNDRLLAYLDEQEVAVLLAVTNELRRTTLSLTGEKGILAGVRLRHVMGKVDVVSTDPPRFAINLDFEGILVQANATADNNVAEFLTSTSRDVETLLENRTKALVQHLQSLGSDALGFAETLYRTKPVVWRRVSSDWESLYRTLEVDVNVDVKILSSGNVTRYAPPAQARP